MRRNELLFDADGNPVGLFDTPFAAAYLGVSTDTLKMWRRKAVNKGPRYFRSGQIVRYRKEDLDSYVARRMVDPSRRAS